MMKLLTILTGVCFALIIYQLFHYTQFMDRLVETVKEGHTFTAKDGQALCERIAAVEKEPKPCRFVEEEWY